MMIYERYICIHVQMFSELHAFFIVDC